MLASMDMDFRFRASRSPSAPRSGRGPLRILVMGDFGGRANRGLSEPGEGLADRRIHRVDLDTFEDVVGRVAPRLELSAGSVRIGELEDFHPDGLYERLDLFRALRGIRKRLLDPATFDDAAAELRREGAAPAAGTETAEPAAEASAGADEEDADTIARLMGSAPAEAPSPATGALEDLIRDAVAPHVVPDADPRQDLYVAAVDEAVSSQMRALLRDPHFRALEAAWTSLDELVRNVELDEDRRLFLLDVTKEELLEDFRAVTGELERSGLYRRLVEKGVGTAGGEPWSVIVGDYSFGAEPADAGLLAGLGAVASRAGGPFLAGADPTLLGFASFADAPDPSEWPEEEPEPFAELRESAVAPWVGLALPRILLRLPYGKATDPVGAFDFEEVASGDDHEGYLWGNPAFGMATLLARSHTDRGWSMSPGDDLDLADLPAHTIEVDGEKAMKPCAEVLLSERAAGAILARGLVPVLSVKSRPAARLVRFQSVASPPGPLAGPWG